MNDEISIVIVDDHEIAQVGLSAILESFSKYNVIGTFLNGDDLFGFLKKSEPDIIFMDIDLGSENGVDVTKKVLNKYPDIYVVAFTSSDEVSYFIDMMEAGASGFLLKNIAKEELKNALEEICNGNMYFSKEFLTIARQLIPKKLKKKQIKISDREKEVLRLICLGCSNQEIADNLKLSSHTVDAHRRNLLNKCGAKNTANLIMIAFKEGLIDYE